MVISSFVRENHFPSIWSALVHKTAYKNAKFYQRLQIGLFFAFLVAYISQNSKTSLKPAGFFLFRRKGENRISLFANM